MVYCYCIVSVESLLDLCRVSDDFSCFVVIWSRCDLEMKVYFTRVKSHVEAGSLAMRNGWIRRACSVPLVFGFRGGSIYG